jgi:hypothetical protein
MKRIVATLVLVATAGYADMPEPQIKIKLKKAEDTAAITSTATSAVITVTSKSGIGGATLTRTGELWPHRSGVESLFILN